MLTAENWARQIFIGFSSELYKQWGTNRTNGIYSFPIPFTEALCCFGGGEAGSGYYDNASAYSNTQVRVYSDGSSRFVSWIAIGA